MNWLANLTVIGAALITALPTGAQQSFPVETQPVYAAPDNPQPGNSAPANAQPVNAAPGETQPVEAQPTTPPQVAPGGTQSACIPLQGVGGEGTQV